LKQAKVVKPGEQPYKIVKGKPRWDRLSRSIVTDPFMDIFGLWQTQDYEPPTAENGIVPRNAYGNVELFKPCMLPKKTVHLRRKIIPIHRKSLFLFGFVVPGLNKVAKKMNIDCASAFRGFEYSAGWFHPAYDGFVVCEEFADVLVAAWEQVSRRRLVSRLFKRGITGTRRNGEERTGESRQESVRELEEIDQRVADQGTVEEKVRVWGDFRTGEEEEGGEEGWQHE
jgi:hypothetical protein